MKTDQQWRKKYLLKQVLCKSLSNFINYHNPENLIVKVKAKDDGGPTKIQPHAV